MIAQRSDHKSSGRTPLPVRFIRAAEFVTLSLLIALILLEGGSYVLRIFLPSAVPTPVDFFHNNLNQQMQEIRDYPKKNANWSEETVEFYSELENTQVQPYESFIGWRTNKRAGRTVNIDDEGNRLTANKPGSVSPTVYDFYGGSTMWGFGVSDANTIPSRFAQLSNAVFARNFAQQGYNSRQELNYFLNNIVHGRIGNTVVFFDGINDVNSGCDSGNGPFGDYETGEIRSMLAMIGPGGRIRNLASNLGIRNKIAIVLPNTTALIERLTGHELMRDINMHLDDRINACVDPEIANFVAENLVHNWEAASLIASQNKATFFAILQPYPDASEMPRYRMMAFDDVKKAIYLSIKAKAGRFNWFVDGTNWLAGRTDLNIDDCCHLNAKGNELIAERIFQQINAK
jgi:hypothetical protein